MLLTPHGFCLLMQGNGEQECQLYRSLLQAGFAPWDRNGLPLFVALHGIAPKAMFFEAGYLAGARVPLFLIGNGATFRRRHTETLGRLGGWACQIDREGELIEQLARRGIEPTAWDVDNCAAFLEKLLAGKVVAAAVGGG